MTSDLYIAVAIMFVIYALLVVTGVNQIRHARLLKLGMDGYVMAGIWLWLAFSGSLGLVLSLNKIVHFGMPVFVMYSNGHEEPYAGILTRQWAVIIFWLLICAGLAIRSYIMLRNVRRFDEKERENAARTHRQMTSLTQITEKMAKERHEYDRVKNATWEQFYEQIQEIKRCVEHEEATQG